MKDKHYSYQATAIRAANTYIEPKVVVKYQYPPDPTWGPFPPGYLVVSPWRAEQLDPQHHTVIYRNAYA